MTPTLDQLFVRRIAFVGAQDFDGAKLEEFFEKLDAKYPDATIVTGNGRGAEALVRSLAERHDFALEVPDLRPDWFGKEAMACQVTSICSGADVIVTVGSESGTRPSLAREWWQRLNRPDLRNALGAFANPTPYFNIAAPPKKAKKKAPARKAKRKEQLAV